VISPKIDVIIPAYNEQESIEKVINAIPMDWVREVIVCLLQPQKGYGSACLKGMEYLAQKSKTDQPDIVVFLDGDFSDHPEELPTLIQPIIEENMDMVIGSRSAGEMEQGAMMPQQIFGNWLATNLIQFFYKYEFTDLGPFRAIKYNRLLELEMNDPDFGWTVEMQVKAAKYKFNCKEVPVSYRQRIGVSKVSGTIRGTILAGHKILWTIFKLI